MVVRRQDAVVVSVAVALATTLFALTYRATDSPHLRHDSALDAAFDSRALVAGARLLIAVALAYLLVSICVRAWRHQWVRGAGSLQTDAPTTRIAEDADDLSKQLEQAWDGIRQLEDALQRSLNARDELRARVDRLEDQGGR